MYVTALLLLWGKCNMYKFPFPLLSQAHDLYNLKMKVDTLVLSQARFV